MAFKRGHKTWNKGLIGIQKHTDETKRKIGLNGFHYGMLGKVAWNKGKKLQPLSRETKLKLSKAHIGHLVSEETRIKIGLGHKGKIISSEMRQKISNWQTGKKLSKETRDKISKANSGENNSRWISDRSLLKKKQERNDSAYHSWRLEVYKSDNYKCRINNCDCSGRIIAHHILGWKSHPELRYEINNGIVLCLFHHPRKRIDEQRLIPIFQQMKTEEVKIN